MAQGTIRPWSERAFFLAFESIFGVNALPFRICVFLTQCANLTLLAAISRRLTGSLLAGFSAAILWLVNNSDTSKRDGARTTYGSGSAFSLVSALAALYNCLCARRFFRSTLPLFLPSAIWRRCCRFAITSRRTTASRAPGRRIRGHDDQRGPQQIARRTYRSRPQPQPIGSKSSAIGRPRQSPFRISAWTGVVCSGRRVSLDAPPRHLAHGWAT